MEYILMTLFGGGTLDWEEVGKTYYDWEDIISLMRNRLSEDMKDWEVNDFFYMVIVYGLEQLEDIVTNFVRENFRTTDKELQDDVAILCDFNMLSDFEIQCNCLDTQCNFVGTDKLRNVLLKHFKEDIDKISEDIAFTYVNMEE